jgi:hypothetical protein
MKILSQSGQDITSLLAPDAEHPATQASPAGDVATTHGSIVETQSNCAPDAAVDDASNAAPRPGILTVDPTFAALTAHHAAQHTRADMPEPVPPPEPAAEPCYIATPGEVALHAGQSMIAQHVEFLYAGFAKLAARVAALEARVTEVENAP